MITEVQALKLGLEQLYEYAPDGETLKTGYGEMKMLQWLIREKIRIEKNPLRWVEVVQHTYNSNMVGLFVNAFVMWESEAERLGYKLVDGWSTCDEDLKVLGYIEPRRILKNKLNRAIAENDGEDGGRRYFVIVRKDKHFALFARNRY